MVNLKKYQSFFSSDKFITLVSIFYVLLILFYAATLFESRQRFCVIFVPISIILCVLTLRRKVYPLKGKSYSIVRIFFILISLTFLVYFWQNYLELIALRPGYLTIYECILSVLLFYVLFEVSRANYGFFFPGLVLAFLIYGYFGKFLPEPLHHGGLSIMRLISSSTINGFLGTLPQIAATWIAIFLVFTALIRGFGGVDYLLKVSGAISRKFKYGVAQLPVFGNMLIGSFTGAATVGAASVGPLITPILREKGFPKSIIGAIISVGSAGSQIMPPIMGAAAFLMCDYLNKYYWDIVVASFPPALVFYLTVAIVVYIISREYMKSEKVEFSRSNSKDFSFSLKRILLEGAPLLSALIFLIVVLAVFLLDVLVAGFYTVVFYLLSVFIYYVYLFKGDLKKVLKEYGINLVKSLRIGAQEAANLGVLLTLMGPAVSVIMNTGVGEKFSWSLVEISGGSLLLLLLMIFFVCIVLGMAISTVAIYILVAIVAAPALTTFGIKPIVAHFVVFYFAMLSAITPPVAGACFIAHDIVKEPFLRVCKEACKLGIPLFILPFSFVIHPELLLANIDTIYHFFWVLTGMLAISLGIYLPTLGTVNKILKVVLFFLGSMSTLCPITFYSLVSTILIIPILGLTFYRLLLS